MSRFLLALLLAGLPLAGFAQSAVPNYVSYQGRVTDGAGNPLGSPNPVNRTVTFRIWSHPSATDAPSRLFTETQTVTIANGEFSVLLGAGTAVGAEPNAVTLESAFSGAVRYLGVTIDDPAVANDPEISPRQQIVTAAYAFRAKVAESVLGQSVTSAMLANNAVTGIQLADSAVTSAKITDLSVATADLGDNIVTSAKIADGAIATADIGNGQITAAKLATDVGAWVANGANVYRATGNVGVGTTTPTAPVSAGSAVANTKIAVWDNGTGTGLMGLGVQSGQLRLHTNVSSDRFSFLNAPAGTEVHTILGNGNVGVNVSNPLYPLSFGPSLANTKIALWDNLSTHAAGLGFQGNQFRLHTENAVSRFSFLNGAAGTETFTILGNGNVGIGDSNPQWGLVLSTPNHSRISLKTTALPDNASFDIGTHSDGAFVWNNRNAYLHFGTNGTERLRIEGDGRMGFGMANTSAGITFQFRAANPAQTTIMHIRDGNGNEAFAFAHQGNAYKPGGGSWSASSDRRLKDNIRDQTGSLERLLKLRSVTFTYKDQARHGAGVQNGFVAQEVETIFPDWVSTGSDGMKMVGTRGFESLAVQALRELRAEKDAQIAALQARVQELEARDASASRRLDQLEQRFLALTKPLAGAAR